MRCSEWTGLYKEVLDQAGIPLYGVQNHYSLIDREWEKNGLVSWCRENGVQFREYLFSDYDLMNSIDIDDFLWMKQHMKEYHLFDPSRQKDQLKQWLTLICDVRPDVDYGTVVNLMKSIYAMWKFRETFVQASFENSVQMILKTLEAYVTGNELSLL